MKKFIKLNEKGYPIFPIYFDGDSNIPKEAIEITDDEEKEYLSNKFFNKESGKFEKIPLNISLKELKTVKLTEVNTWTAAKITGGFVSSCSGEPVTYDSDKETQLTVSSDMSTIQLAPDKFKENYPEGYPMRGYPKGVDTSNSENKVVYYLTFEQLIQWNVDIGLHRGACKQAGWVKQTAVNNAKNIDDLNNIVLE